jgi:hypothetical protein
LEKKFMEFAFFFKYIIQLKLNFFQKCIFAQMKSKFQSTFIMINGYDV